MKKITFLICSFLTIAAYAQHNITFSVDMAGQTFTQPYVSGSFNSWSGDANPLTNISGTIWEVTLPLADGEYEYKFTYDNWVGQEAFTQGDVCTITNYGNHNRRLVVSGSAQSLATAPFGGCAESSSNPGPHSVTFNVDMNAYGGVIGTVNLNGENHNSQGLGNWCGSCIALTDQGGGIWSITLSLEEFSYQFKFTVDGWANPELFSPGDAETATDGANTNRYIKVDEDKTVNFTWNVPMGNVLSNEKFANLELELFPNPTDDKWQIKARDVIENIEIFNVLGKSVLRIEPNRREVSIDGEYMNTGMYIAKVSTANGIDTIKLIKQ